MEQIIKKEEKLEYKGKGAGILGKRGALVLTSQELYFTNKKNHKAFNIPLDKIISVNIRKGLGNGIDYLFVIFNDNSKERKVKIKHFTFWAGVAMGNLSQLRELYFKSWETAIENVRFGKNTVQNSNLNELEKLAELKEKGIINEEEFNTKKKQILGL